jgi:hypothetical protein
MNIEAIRALAGEFDQINGPREYDGNIVDGKIVNAVCHVRVNYEKHSSAVTFTVYENGTFLVGGAACATNLEAIKAYARAYAMIQSAGLRDAR